MSSWPIRTRITLLVSVVAGLALVAVIAAGFNTVEDTVTDNALESTSSALLKTEQALGERLDGYYRRLQEVAAEVDRTEADIKAAEENLAERIEAEEEVAAAGEEALAEAARVAASTGEPNSDERAQAQDEVASLRDRVADDRAVAADRVAQARDGVVVAREQTVDFQTRLDDARTELSDGPAEVQIIDDGGNSIGFANLHDRILLGEASGQIEVGERGVCQTWPGNVSCEARPGQLGDRTERISEEFGDDPPAVTIGDVLEAGDSSFMVFASQDVSEARSTTTLTTGVGALAPLLLLILVALIAFISWISLGRALTPVEAMTAQLSDIDDASLDQRIRVPEAKDELHRLATTMNGMLDRLQRSRDNQRQFISDASHELRSPITATQLTLDVAKANPDSTDWRELAEVVSEENGRLAQLVDDLLLLARLDEQAGVTETVPVDLDEVCLAEAERPHPSEVTVRIVSPARVHGNPAMLRRAIRNLVDNATRHANAAVEITVGIVETSGAPQAEVRVDDDGPGVTAADQTRIFERFTRLEEARERMAGGGAGLGLAIVREVVEAHGGVVTIVEAPASGASFVVRLPLARP